MPESGVLFMALTIRKRVDAAEVPSFIVKSLREVRLYIERRHLKVEGPPFSNCRQAPNHRFDVEVGWPLARGSGAGRIHRAELPAGPSILPR